MLALVIDDSATTRTILKWTVAQLGFDVIEARNGQEAFELLAAIDRAPDLALVDWNTREMNALEFISTVRADPKLTYMTLIMVTTQSDQSQVVRALAAGALGYVIKPFATSTSTPDLVLLGLVPTGASRCAGP